MGYDQMSCKVNNRLGGLPLLSEFSLVNESFSPEMEGTSVGGNLTCSLDELQHFQSFFFKFMNVVREFLLPPERIQFGLISKKALLPELNIESNDSWLMTLHYSGCPSCLKLLTENDDLKIVLQTQEAVVGELGDYVHDFLPTLPVNKPSVLLFIDRSSNSVDIRKQSKDVLQDFRKLALHYKVLNQTRGFESTLQHSKLSKTTHNALGTPLHPRLLQLLPQSVQLTLKDKTSGLVLNEGKQITLEKVVSDFQGSSLHEMLTYLLQQKKEIKLSSLAKDAGFQLLSEDFEIKATKALSSKTKECSDQDLEFSDNILEGTANSDDEEKLAKSFASNSMTDKDFKSTDNEPLHKVNEKDVILSAQLSDKSSHSHTNEALDSSQSFFEDGKPEEEILTGTDVQKRWKYLSGSFFFCDGNIRVLRTLTGGSRIPSVVIIDPIAAQHYIIPENDALNYSSLSDFLEEFLNGSLTPYQQSEPVVQSSREVPSPPFVNLDFHEADSLPRVTANVFNELVLGNKFYSENPENAWNRDVLVLFSNSWCGFCQRMELIVREVYRTIKSYTVMLKSGVGNDSILSKKDMVSDNTKNSLLKIPLIYLMDCTLNDCSYILKTEFKREVYPSLLLFPALRKEAVAYEGDLAVSDILNFLADHGILVHEKGVIWHVVEHSKSSKTSHQAQTTNHEVLLKDRKQELAAKHNQIQIQSLIGSYETTPQVAVGSFLTATNKLLDVYPFDASKVLIVKVDQGKVIEGLITNKLIKWDSLEQFEESLELLKDAPLSFGGPVMKHGMPLVALSNKRMKDEHIEVLPGVYFLDQQATLQLVEELRSGIQSLHGCWFFVGFSSWDWDQLFNEISIGAWHVSEGSSISQLDWPKVP